MIIYYRFLGVGVDKIFGEAFLENGRSNPRRSPGKTPFRVRATRRCQNLGNLCVISRDNVTASLGRVGSRCRF